jgi:non-ribosomal peptide synthetase component F
LPTDYPRPSHQTFRGAHQHLILSVELLESIRNLSRRERVTTFMTVLAAFQVLLYRYTSQEDMVIGMPIGNRNRTEIEGLIGFFINTLVLRTDMSGDPTFQQLLQRVREVTLAAYAHQDLPFEKLVDEFQPRRDPSRNPLFQVAFTFQNASNEQLKLDGLRSSYLPVENLNSKFDLTVIAQDLQQGLYISFQYSTDLFAPTTIVQMQKYFEQLLYSILAQPKARLSQLEMFSEEESLLFEKPIEIEDLNTSFIF